MNIPYHASNIYPTTRKFHDMSHTHSFVEWKSHENPLFTSFNCFSFFFVKFWYIFEHLICTSLVFRFRILKKTCTVICLIQTKSRKSKKNCSCRIRNTFVFSLCMWSLLLLQDIFCCSNHFFPWVWLGFFLNVCCILGSHYYYHGWSGEPPRHSVCVIQKFLLFFFFVSFIWLSLFECDWHAKYESSFITFHTIST